MSTRCMTLRGPFSNQAVLVMRLAFALLLIIVTAAPALAQQTRALQGAQQPGSSEKPGTSHEIMRQRILLRERFNKGWDIQPEDPRQRAARCRAEARKRYSVIRQLKRRKYIKHCIAENHLPR